MSAQLGRVLACCTIIAATAPRAEAAPPAEVAADAEARGLPLTALFHAARAKQQGVEVAVRPLDLEALWADLPTRPSVTLPEGCGWLRGGLDARYPPERANVAIDAQLTCAAAERTWNEHQDYVWYEEIPRTETRTVPGQTVYVSRTCTRAGPSVCQSYTNTGQTFCTPTTQSYECGSSTTGPDTTEQVTVVDRIPHDGNHEVTRRTLSVSVSGSLSSSIGDAGIEWARATDEISFHDEHGSQELVTTLDQLLEGSVSAVSDAIATLVAPVRDAQRDRELEAAASAADALTAEEHRLRAWTLGDPATALAQAYGLTEAQLAELLVSVGFEIPWALQVHLYQEQQAEAVRNAPRPPRKPGVLGRLLDATRLIVTRTTRTGDDLTSLGFAARVELGSQLRRIFDYALGLWAGGGTDGEHGTSFDVRAALLLGTSSHRHQLAYVVGLGFAGIGVRPTGAGMSTLETRPDAFHGLDLRIGGRPLALAGRLLQVRGGALGDETRASAQLLFATGPWRLGLEGSIQQYDGLAELSDTKVSAVGVTVGYDRGAGR